MQRDEVRRGLDALRHAVLEVLLVQSGVPAYAGQVLLSQSAPSGTARAGGSGARRWGRSGGYGGSGPAAGSGRSRGAGSAAGMMSVRGIGGGW